MTLVWLLWVILCCWFVCIAIQWFPNRIAEEEAFWIAELKAEQLKGEGASAPTKLNPAVLSFCCTKPSNRPISWVSIFLVALFSGWSYLVYGATAQSFLWVLFGCGLIVLAVVDYQTKLLPDALTLPLLWLGILIQLFPDVRTVGLELSIIGVVAGYLPLWVLAQTYKLIRKRDGMGMGDLKLLAAMGAWSGPFLLPQVLLIAALLAIALFVVDRWLLRKGSDIHEERPFGPAIVVAYFLVLLWAN